jgi:hypothetical protein
LEYQSGGERRRTSRRKSFGEAWADPGGTVIPTVCKVLDISSEGAGLTIRCESTLTDTFFLHIGTAKHLARVVWRSEQRLGVEFQKPISVETNCVGLILPVEIPD